MPLHLAYRPKDFDSLVGNESLVESLKAIFERESDYPHSWLFQGSSGCGKTTLARIVADKLGCKGSDFVEINAASNRGIDTARSIVDNMKYKPQVKGSKSRVFLIDECFAKGTKIKTLTGEENIEDIKVGDKIFSLAGEDIVKNIFKNKIPLNRVIKISTNNKTIYCSIDHKFFTSKGWVKAKKLKNNSLIYPFNYNIMSDTTLQRKDNYDISKTVSNLQYNDGIPHYMEGRIQQKNMLEELWSKIKKSKSRIQGETLQQRNTKKDFRNKKEKFSIPSLFRISKTIFRKNEEKQSFSQSMCSRKNVKYQKNKWDLTCLASRAWRQWKIYTTSNSFSYCFGMADGSCCENGSFPQRQFGVYFELQDRYRERNIENRNRSGRTESSNRLLERKRLEENIKTEFIRVENIEIYKRGSNEQSFRNIVGDTERNQEFVEFYDLEMTNHPSYFANGVGVHNCHQVTGDAANALLKALEEPPPHVYFLLCTTDPDKLLKTIRNRCTPFEVQPLSNRQLIKLLNFVCEKEGVDDLSENTLKMISEVSDGCPRQALVLLDQIIDMPLDKMEGAIKDFRSAEKNIFDLTNALLDKKNWDVVRKILEGMDLSNPENIRLSVIGIMAKRVMKSECATASLVYDIFEKPFYNVGKNGLIMACNKVCMMLS